MQRRGNLEGNGSLLTAVWLGPLVFAELLGNEAGEVNQSQRGSPTQGSVGALCQQKKTGWSIIFLLMLSSTTLPGFTLYVSVSVPSTPSFLTVSQELV